MGRPLTSAMCSRTVTEWPCIHHSDPSTSATSCAQADEPVEPFDCTIRFLWRRNVRNLVRMSLLCATLTAWCGTNLIVAHAQGQPPPDRPAVTVRGQTYTPRSILHRNIGTEQDQTTQFPPHKIVGNVYYVGTRTLSAFLITTPQGHVLVNTMYERNVPVIEKSIADL